MSRLLAQYELAGQAEARPFFAAPNPGTSDGNAIFRTFTSILPDTFITSANRPTLILVPGDDATATRQFFTSIPADTLVFLTQSGWPASTILRLWIEGINGVPNASTASNPARCVAPGFARFQRIAELLQLTQDNQLGAVVVEERFTEVSGPLPSASITAAAVVEAARNGLQYRPCDEGASWVLVRPGRQLVLQINAGTETNLEILELETLSNLQPGRRRYDLVTTAGGIPDPLRVPSPPSPVVRLVPRSTAQVYYYLANGIDVPTKHLQCGLVPVPVDDSGTVFDTREVTRGLFEVHVAEGHKPPRRAYVAVRYRGYWFYIDDRDQASKATFGLVLQLSRLDFRRQQLGAGPVLTLPEGR